MSAWGILLIIVGILAVLLGICALAVWLRKIYPYHGDEYDERQKQARGDAYRLAFGAGIVYDLLIAMGIGMENPSADLVFSLLLAGIFGQVMLVIFYCFLTHAELPLGKKPLGYAVSSFALSMLNILEFLLVGQSWVKLAAGMCFLTMAVLYLIAYIRQKRE